MDLLDQIAQKLHNRELILFVGSGMSAAVTQPGAIC
jgi:fructoselysine-6-P-deglycase FrlB-like protein